VNVLKLDDMSESADSGIVSATTSISDLSLREDENPVKKVLVRSTRKQDIRSKAPKSLAKQQQEIIGRPETESGDAKELPQLKAETLPQNFALADARKLVDLNAKPLRTKDLSSLRFQSRQEKLLHESSLHKRRVIGAPIIKPSQKSKMKSEMNPV